VDDWLSQTIPLFNVGYTAGTAVGLTLDLNLGCLHPVACERSGDGGFLFCLRNVTIVG
jgi:hypothetical protein